MPATDSFRSRGGNRKTEMGLDQMARKVWPTPKAMTGGPNSKRDQRPQTGGPDLQEAVKHQPGQLSPRWVETLMGIPIGWTCPSCTSPVIPALTNSPSAETA